MRLLMVCVLAGCTPLPQATHTIAHHILVTYTPQTLDPSNCGTPDDYKLCITAPGPRPPIPHEDLPDLTPPRDDDDATAPEPLPPPPPGGV
jgi:hypothetical protein